MSAMIERVARAIEDSIVVECHTHTTADLDYIAAARAAIAAMADPSEEMLSAGGWASGRSWRRMIDAALAEP